MRSARTRLLAIGAIAVIGLASAVYAYSRKASVPLELQGWIEAYFIFVAPDETGRVETLSVREADAVTPGSPLYTLDSDLQKAAVAESEASVENARVTYDRARELLKKSVGSQKAFDDAEAALRTAEARLNSARTRLARRSVASPTTGIVQEVYFRVGEMVPAGRPVVSVLPPENVRVRFFVPQATLPLLRIGDKIAVRCDGCAPDLTARIYFISAQAEFTPPVIYSQKERARLVFRVEAIPENPENLRVGQPVSVALSGAAGVSHARK